MVDLLTLSENPSQRTWNFSLVGMLGKERNSLCAGCLWGDVLARLIFSRVSFGKDFPRYFRPILSRDSSLSVFVNKNPINSSL